MAPQIFYSEKDKVYFFVSYGDIPLCDICNQEIKVNLVYHTSWKKTSDSTRNYHINCFEKINLRGFMDEFKYCVVVDKVPSGTLPVFERRPTLSGKSGFNAFEVSKILKNSEAEIKDRTVISKDPNQGIMVDYDKNKRLLEKRDEELGYSPFLLDDLRKDESLQQEVERKAKEMEEEAKERENSIAGAVDKVAGKKEVQKVKKTKPLPIREKYYGESLPLINTKQESSLMENFFSLVKESDILLPAKAEIHLVENKTKKLDYV